MTIFDEDFIKTYGGARHIWPGLSRLLVCCLVVTITYLVQASSANRGRFVNKRAASSYQLTVNLSYSSHSIENTFLGVCMEPSALWRFCDPAWVERAKNLAKPLSPCELRMGGTSSHYVTFDTLESECSKPEETTSKRSKRSGPDLSNEDTIITITGKLWETLHSFLSDVGWDLLFDFNLFKLNTTSGLWDPSNAAEILNFSADRDIHLPFFQLGNEPNAYYGNYNYTINPQTMVESYKVLKSLLSQYPKYSSSKLYGPDVTNLDVRRNPSEYLQGFLEAGAQSVIDEVSIHHYYDNGKTATNESFLNETVMDSLTNVLNLGFDIINKFSNPPLNLRLTETSSLYGGGAPGLSNRYIAGFLWLDKLGVSALSGITRVFRQAFLGASYSLASVDMTSVYPDYFLSVLFKQLVEGPVFNISVEPANPKLRVYANCARDHLYKAGAVIVYFLNIGSQDVTLSLTQFSDYDLHLYMLTPGDDEGLTSSTVKLNGQVLGLTATNLRSISPMSHRGDVTVSATSFGFVVVPFANAELCTRYYPDSTTIADTATSPITMQNLTTSSETKEMTSSSSSIYSNYSSPGSPVPTKDYVTTTKSQTSLNVCPHTTSSSYLVTCIPVFMIWLRYSIIHV